VARCRTERPELAGGSHAVACHRADELLPLHVVPHQYRRSPTLERLVNAFRRRTDDTVGAGVDKVPGH
jgi:hypothetical protein